MAMKLIDQPSVTKMDRVGVYKMDKEKNCQKKCH